MVIIAKNRKDGWSVRATGGGDSPLFDDIFDDLDSEENELALEARYTLGQLLNRADVDAKAREIIWSNGERLSIRESIERLCQGCAQYRFEMVELQFVFWLMEFSPESNSQAQSDEYEALTERWLDEYSRQYGFVL